MVQTSRSSCTQKCVSHLALPFLYGDFIQLAINTAIRRVDCEYFPLSSSELISFDLFRVLMAWTSSSFTQEIQRLTQLLGHYETENVHQRQQLEEADEAKEGHIKRIQELEHDKTQLQQKLRSVEISLKFEKIAAEGARKKVHTMEIDYIDAKERYQNAKTELEMVKKKEQELTLTLQRERISRLQILHEKERVQRINEDLQQKLYHFENDNVDSHKRLLLQLQRVETLLEQNHRQDRLIGAQSQEIYTLNNEVVDYKLRTMDLNRTIEEEVDSHSRYHYAIDYLQQEISRLRKLISDSATDFAGKSHSVYTADKSKASVDVMDKVNTLTAKRYQESNFTADHLFSTRAAESNGTLSSTDIQSSLSKRTAYSADILAQTRKAQSEAADLAATMPHTQSFAIRRATPVRAVSPMTSIQRPRSTNDYKNTVELEGTSWSSQQEEESYFNSPERADMLNWIRRAGSRQQQSRPSYSEKETSLLTSSTTSLSLPPLSSLQFGETSQDSTIAPGQHPQTAAAEVATRSTKTSDKDYDTKSLYVGSGLAFKHNKALNTQLKNLQAGSTKQILKRILGDQVH